MKVLAYQEKRKIQDRINGEFVDFNLSQIASEWDCNENELIAADAIKQVMQSDMSKLPQASLDVIEVRQSIMDLIESNTGDSEKMESDIQNALSTAESKLADLLGS